MRLLIYGDSITQTDEGRNSTFVDRLYSRLGCAETPGRQIARGIPFCSSERILYWTKKRRDADMFIIFHGRPKFWYMPGFDRDANGYEEPSKLALRYAGDLRYTMFQGMHHDRWDEQIRVDGKVVMESQANLQDAAYSPNLAANRHMGALLLLDQYLLAKSIPVVHCVHDDTLPSWMPRFNSGITDKEVADFQKHGEYGCSYNRSVNAVTDAGNDLITERLSGYVEMLLGGGSGI